MLYTYSLCSSCCSLYIAIVHHSFPVLKGTDNEIFRGVGGGPLGNSLHTHAGTWKSGLVHKTKGVTSTPMQFDTA